jgi:hypothetical protein
MKTFFISTVAQSDSSMSVIGKSSTRDSAAEDPVTMDLVVKEPRLDEEIVGLT